MILCVEDPLGNGHMTDHTMSMQSLIPFQTLGKYIASIKVTHGVEVLDTWMQPLCILYNITCIITYESHLFLFIPHSLFSA